MDRLERLQNPVGGQQVVVGRHAQSARVIVDENDCGCADAQAEFRNFARINRSPVDGSGELLMFDELVPAVQVHHHEGLFSAAADFHAGEVFRLLDRVDQVDVARLLLEIFRTELAEQQDQCRARSADAVAVEQVGRIGMQSEFDEQLVDLLGKSVFHGAAGV